MGHTGGRFNRFGIFENRIAPIQVSFLDLCTTASKSIDYLIADKILIPKEFQNFIQKIIYLPDSYQPNEELNNLSPIKNKSVGLPNDKFVFCCFNAHQKINPQIFSS